MPMNVTMFFLLRFVVVFSTDGKAFLNGDVSTLVHDQGVFLACKIILHCLLQQGLKSHCQSIMMFWFDEVLDALRCFLEHFFHYLK